jgi:hypothetical protein
VSGGAVPVDDLPGNLVPADDLPGANTPAAILKDTGKGLLAAAAGSPVDLATMLMRPFGYKTPSEEIVGSSDYFSKKMGANSNLQGSAYRLGGLVTDQASKVLPPEGAAAAGFVANVGTQAIPMVLGGSLGKSTAPAFDGMSRGLMRSALKPSVKAVATGQADEAVSTMLREGLTVSNGSVKNMANRVDDLNTSISGQIAGSSATVDPLSAASRIRPTLDKFGKQVDPAADIDAITGVVTRFLNNHPNAIPVQLAQELKQGTYRVLKDKYGQLGSADVEAQKAIARGLKEEIAAAVPGINDLNKLESELLNAMKLTSRRMATQNNANPLGITHLAPTTWQLALGMLDRSAWAKSALANGLNSGVVPANVGRIGGGIMGGYMGNEPQQGILDRKTTWMGSK